MRPTFARRNDDVVGYQHPTDTGCENDGHHVGAKILEAWHPMLAYEVVDGYPVFNNRGRGKAATVELVNRCFAYVRGQPVTEPEPEPDEPKVTLVPPP